MTYNYPMPTRALRPEVSLALAVLLSLTSSCGGASPPPTQTTHGDPATTGGTAPGAQAIAPPLRSAFAAPPWTEVVREPQDGAILEVAVGTAHTCARWERGAVRCWGANDMGQLGNGTHGPSFAAAQSVQGLGSGTRTDAVSQLALGHGFSCARMADGHVRCWGANQRGELGDGSATFSRRAVEVAGLADATQLVAAYDQVCALRANGEVWCWGGTPCSRMVTDVSIDSPPALRPARVPGLADVAEISTGMNVVGVCARTRSGQISCFGTGGPEECVLDARGGAIDYTPRPAPVAGMQDATSLSAGSGPGYGCAAKADGGVWCWGWGEEGRARIASAAEVTSLSVAHAGVCGLRASGGVRCWDRNAPEIALDQADLGDQVAAIAMGNTHWCARMRDGSARCTGASDSGQLGAAYESFVVTPRRIALAEGATHVSAGLGFTCASLRGGGVECWGAGAPQISGTNADVHDPAPKRVHDLSEISAISAGARHVCAVRAGRAVVCWGDSAPAVGVNGSSTPRPIEVLRAEGIADLSAGADDTCVVTADGAVTCWGYNIGYLLHDRGEGNAVAPTRVSVLSPTTSIAIGGWGAFAIGQRGEVVRWGATRRTIGMARPASSTPTPIPELRGATRISSSDGIACASLPDGKVYCWGDYLYSNSHTPLPISGITNPVSLAVGSGSGPTGDSPIEIAHPDFVAHHQACAARADGRVLCWRWYRSSTAHNGWGFEAPTIVEGLTDVMEVTVGSSHACALKRDGSVLCWGTRGALDF